MSFEGLLGCDLLSKAESKCSTKDLDLGSDGTLGLYFSAHWCPPCRTFTPKLAEFYNKVNAGGKKFRIVFVSLDRDEAQFTEYFKEMPWHAIPFESDKREEIAEKLGVRGIPTLVLYDSSANKLATKSDARTMVQSDSEGKDFPWSV